MNSNKNIDEAHELSPGGATSEKRLAKFMDAGRRAILDNIIVPFECDGVPCVSVGNGYLIRNDALVDWIEANERLQKRSKRGTYKREQKRKCDENPPCSGSA